MEQFLELAGTGILIFGMLAGAALLIWAGK